MSPRNYHAKFTSSSSDSWWYFSKSLGHEIEEDKVVKKFFYKFKFFKKKKDYNKTSDFK
jgi:hypothetical protein